jgi:hypothetical protein
VQLCFDPNICNNKLKIGGVVQNDILNSIPKLPKNPIWEKAAILKKPSSPMEDLGRK